MNDSLAKLAKRVEQLEAVLNRLVREVKGLNAAFLAEHIAGELSLHYMFDCKLEVYIGIVCREYLHVLYEVEFLCFFLQFFNRSSI